MFLRLILCLLLCTLVSGANFIQSIFHKLEEANATGGMCSVGINRQLIRSEVQPEDGYIPSYTMASFYNDDESIDNLFCDYGFWQIEELDDNRKEPNKPPSITCPTVADGFAPMLEHTAVVRWTDPSTSDPEGGSVRLNRVHGKPPGSAFGHGSHIIKYEAEDNSGNKASCTIVFKVTVRYCLQNLYVENGRPVCNTSDNIHGTNCSLECSVGYELPLNTTNIVSCTTQRSTDVNWSPISTAVCKKMKCPPPTELCNGYLVCSNDNSYEFESTCHPVCNDGYDTDQAKSLSCNGTHWIGVIQPCVDIEPPSFLQCPTSITKFADRAKTTTPVTWTVPSATDNSIAGEDCSGPSSVTIAHVSGSQPGSQLEIGIHEISYTAKDLSDNTGYCNFSVVVEELSCDPLVLNDSYVLQRCPNGYSYGSVCSFECTLGYQLEGDQNITCEKDPSNNQRGIWPWTNDTQTFCEKLRCPDLPAPTGGALTCSEALGNQICVMSCSDRYQAAKGTPLQYVCGEGQEWIQGIPPNCTDRVNPRNVILPGELFYYYSGDCSNTSVQQGIKNNFVNVMENMDTDGWENICPSYCTVKGVTVTCGPQNGRRKRNIQKRDLAVGNQIVLNFNIYMEWLPNKTFRENENLANAVGDTIESKTNGGAFDVAGITPNLAFGWSDIACDQEGLVPDYNEGTCVGCAPGKYLKDDECLECQKGYYQDEEYQVTCKICPVGYSTANSGSTSSAECKEKCRPGSFSNTGVQPCSVCPLGYYQPMPGSTECMICPSNKYTESTGSTKCFYMDAVFVESGANVTLPRLTYSLSSFTLGFLVKMFNTSKSLEVTIAHITIIVGKEIYVKLNGHNVGMVTQFDTQKWTQITITWDNSYREIKCYCNGEEILSGDFRMTDLPFRSNLMIVSGDPGSKLSSLFLTSVHLPENNITKIAKACHSPPENTQNYAVIYNMSVLFSSEGSGIQLSQSTCDAVDDCLGNPCGRNNICTDHIDSYKCTCLGGYSGSHCEVPPDFCVGHQCSNGSTCLTHFTNYTCLCAPGFKGRFCDTQIINGNWGSWLDWSECSKSCDGGIQYRVRHCTNPPPDPDGFHCVGSNTSERNCNPQECPVCPHYMTKIYSYKNKFNCTTNGDSISCIVTCQDGYTFVDTNFPLDKYECGPHTDYSWNSKKAPPCCRNTSPRNMRVTTLVSYDNVDDGEGEIIGNSVRDNAQGLRCIENSTCSISTQLVQSGNRKRRSSSATLALVLSTNISDENLNLDDFYAYNILSPGLLDFVNRILDVTMSVDQLNNSDILTANVSGKVYFPDMSSLTSVGNFTCPEGNIISNSLLCAECSVGTYWEDGRCALCPVGTYQDFTGQMSCKECPAGLTTFYVAANSSSDCTESKCPGGTFWENEECIWCPVGTYRDESESIFCKLCPAGFTTVNTSSERLSDCSKECPIGTHWENGRCKICPIGTFQDLTAAFSCKPCPHGMVTFHSGSNSSTDCKRPACQAGTYWGTGRCDVCPVGTYQDSVAQLACKQCPPGLTTLNTSSDSITDCIEDVTNQVKNKKTELESHIDTIIIAVVVGVVVIIVIICLIFMWKYREHLRQIARKRAFGSITSLDMVHPELTIYVPKTTPAVKRIFRPSPEQTFATDPHHSNTKDCSQDGNSTTHCQPPHDRNGSSEHNPSHNGHYTRDRRPSHERNLKTDRRSSNEHNLIIDHGLLHKYHEHCFD
ncbi:unnamed protein product [Mytilus edulis]|uniref:Sushi, von Willebrand factor type A, EGF and pentraxin domain-containing protein 1 n=1 Tax=Mytilus edulis TaxID=6550 RepID=A0A8S3SNN4_MYTED|nr:unnamed protein product [Mytilus edulis]